MTASDVPRCATRTTGPSRTPTRGTTVIASAGNDASDGDHTADLIHLPGDTQGVISISATAPIGWATAPETTFLDNLASYSNFGRSVIDFAAPGGDVQYPGDENCTIAGLTRPCWVFDLVFSTGNNGWYWSAGTSMAAPHAAGVAALIIGANGGEMKPSQVERELRRTADRITGGELGRVRRRAGRRHQQRRIAACARIGPAGRSPFTSRAVGDATPRRGDGLDA